MEIVVCVKRVPDTSEAELAIAANGRSVEVEDLTFGTNEWDDYAVEAAVALKEEHGGRVRVVTLGDEESEEVLRRALAMGADEALHLRGEALEDADAFATATALAAAIRQAPFDLVLCGAVSSDGAGAQVGGMLAALLDVPQVALASHLEVKDGTATVRHEADGGLERVVEMELPALVTVQTGINEPRYVSIRGIRKVASVEIPTVTVGETESRVALEGLELPPSGEGAEILEGDVEEAVATLVERLRERGGILR